MDCTQTTQDKVSPIGVLWNEEDLFGINPPIINEYVESKASYAIPLEIIYLTPLRNWNPYNIAHIPLFEYDFTISGQCSPESAPGTGNPLPGWTEFKAYFTPAGFYDYQGSKTVADTAQSGLCAQDENGNEQAVFASGLYITTPSIGNDVGIVRLRYPIPPIHKSGDLSFKEIKALEAILLEDNYDPIDGMASDYLCHFSIIYLCHILIVDNKYFHYCNKVIDISAQIWLTAAVQNQFTT